MALTPDELRAYLARLGLEAPVTADEAGLGQLLQAHLQAIPFENLDYFAPDATRPLAREALVARLVYGRRGGCCDEHALLFRDACLALGFEAELRIGRVIVIQAEESAARTHVIVVVRDPSGRTWLADPGFGGPGSRLPIPFVDQAQVSSEAGEYHTLVRRDDGAWVLHGGFQAGALGRPLWVFRDERAFDVDVEVTHHYVMKHPASPLLRGPMLMRYTPRGRTYVRGREVVDVDGNDVRRYAIEDLEHFVAIVREHGLDLPDDVLERGYRLLEGAALRASFRPAAGQRPTAVAETAATKASATRST